MKKTIVIAVLILAVLACHRKTVPVLSTVVADTTAIAVTVPSQAEVVAQGKTVYTNRCGRCHALKNVENYTAQSWDGILKSMIPKARLNDAEAQQVTAYVMEHARK